MVRLNGQTYENKRSRFLLKRKEFQDAEYEIIEIVEGEGNRSGMAGYARLRLDKDREFKSNIKGERDFLRTLLQRKEELVGKQATVKFFRLTPDGVPRFPAIKTIHETNRW